jgi:hypothetical protein
LDRTNPELLRLTNLLAMPNERIRGDACPEYADVPQVVVAQTTQLAFLVSIPHDGCGHYLRPVVVALQAARGL